MFKGRVKPPAGLNLRVKPNGELVDVLDHGEEVTIVDEVTFYRVKTVDGRVGYVHGNYLERLPSAALMADHSTQHCGPDFTPVVFAHERFIGAELRADRDFVPDLQRLAGFADRRDLKIWVTSSLRPLNTQVRGAIVKPATRSCHHIGHAIDMNVVHGGTLYNSSRLKKQNHASLPDAVRGFLDDVRADEVLRWGGDFHDEDPVHIDNNFFHRNQILYQAKLDRRVLQSNV